MLCLQRRRGPSVERPTRARLEAPLALQENHTLLLRPEGKQGGFAFAGAGGGGGGAPY